MIGTLIGIILVLAFLGILWWAAQRILPMLPIGEPFLTIIHVLLVVLAAVIAIWVIVQLLTIAGIHVPFFR